MVVAVIVVCCHVDVVRLTVMFVADFWLLLRLIRRRLGGTSRRHGRSFLGSPGNDFANGSRGVTGGGSLAGGGDNDDDEEEQDEGLMAEDASLMFLTAIRQGERAAADVLDPTSCRKRAGCYCNVRR